MLVGAATDKGMVRNINQDSMFLPDNPSIKLFIVADGMGGHKAGEIASKLAIENIHKYINDTKDMITSIEKAQATISEAMSIANRQIYEYSTHDQECDGMGTTVTLAYIYRNKIVIGHVGDSRAYIIRRGGIAQLTEDHSLVNQLIKGGKITIEEAVKHPQRHVITRAVGTSEDIEIDTIVLKPEKDDILILCSDGLTNMVGDIELLSIFVDRQDMHEACNVAVDLAKANGGNDNITVIAIRI
jgi:protein phosphatase